MDNETTETRNHEFAREIAKTFVLTAASTAGVIAGTMVVGSALTWRENRRNRKALKNQNTEN